MARLLASKFQSREFIMYPKVRKYDSGCEKRKKKRRLELSAQKQRGALDRFVVKDGPIATENQTLEADADGTPGPPDSNMNNMEAHTSETDSVPVNPNSTDNDDKICSEANSLAKNELGDFEFLVGIIIWYEILYAQLQEKDMLIDVAIEKVKGLILFFSKYRESDDPSSVSNIKRKRQFDETPDDPSIVAQSAEESIRVNYFLPVVDQAIASLTRRGLEISGTALLPCSVGVRNLFHGMPPRTKGRKGIWPARPEVSLDDLPDEVLQHVLSFVPAAEAVQTCVLARRWRHLWRSATGLRIECSELDPSFDDIREFVDHLLLLRGGSPLDTCELALNNYDTSRVNLWTRHILLCKVRALSLDLIICQDFAQIHELTLVSEHLKTLQLTNIEFNNEFLDFSCCPALEVLEIKDCDFSGTDRISSQSLKCLSIGNGCFFSTKYRFRIYAPNLHSLRLDVGRHRTPALERMPSLVEAFVVVEAFVNIFDCNKSIDSCDNAYSRDCSNEDCFPCYGIDGDTNNCVLLQGLSEAQNLSLISDIKMFIFRRDLKQRPIFGNLKTLLLNEYWCVPADFSALAYMLEHSPILEKLTLQLFCKGPKSKVEMKGVPDPTGKSAAIVDVRNLLDVMPPRTRGGKGKGAACTEVSRDSLDALPDEVLQHVLSFLPAPEAVRTCVLARRWRHLWRSATGLRIVCDEDGGSLFVDDVREFVDNLLLLRGGSPLDRCELTLYNFSGYSSSRVNLWIRHILLCKVRALSLDLISCYDLAHIYELTLVSERLKTLKLTNLRFSNEFLDFSCCPVLEGLEIEECDFSVAERISSQSLKCLSISNECYFSQQYRFRVCAPNLHSLRLDVGQHRTPALERMPSLVEAFVDIVDCDVDSCGNAYSGDCDNGDCSACHGIDGDTHNCVLLQALSEARNLSLISDIEVFIFRRDLNWCPIFVNLKTLLLNEYWCVPADFSALAYMLEHSPILENLTLQLFCEEPKVQMKGTPDPTRRSAAMSEHLNIVEVKCEVVDDNLEPPYAASSASSSPPPFEPPPSSVDVRNLLDGMPPRTRGGKGKGAARPEVSRDSLDVLPDEVLQHVLSFLPAPEAVRTRDLKRCPTFGNLKTLLLNEYWCVPADFSALAYMLEHSLILEKLTLQLFCEPLPNSLLPHSPGRRTTSTFQFPFPDAAAHGSSLKFLPILLHPAHTLPPRAGSRTRDGELVERASSSPPTPRHGRRRRCHRLNRHRSGSSVDVRNLFDGMPPRTRGGKGKGPARPEVSRDSLDALPDDVLQHVLSFLPAPEAVRTCVLAGRWRYLWRSATGLRIVCSDVEGLSYVDDVREFVDHLLLLRGCSPLDTCELTLCISNAFDTSRMNLWIRHILLCKVRALSLNVVICGSLVEINELALVSEHLKTLQLSNLQFNDEFLDFSCCPALEVLEIDECDFSAADRISSQSLKCLSISNECYFNDECRFRICAPNLHSLRLDIGEHRTPVLERMPSLVEAFVKIVDHEDFDSCDNADSGDCDDEYCFACHGIDGDTNNCVLLQGLSEARNLSLISDIKVFIFRRDLKWCPIFGNLKTLLLNEYWCVPADFSALAYMLEHSPILEKLTLQLFCKEPKSKVQMKGIPDPTGRSAAMSEHLEIVEVNCEVVDDNVLDVLKFLSKLGIDTYRFLF
ncbi:hypothetical protein EJB05_36994, partial [Eragrostis curvula]